MKKLLLTGAVLLCSYFTTKAQTIVFSENFNETEGTWDGSEWTQHNVDGAENNANVAGYFDPNYTWTLLHFTATPDDHFAASTSWVDPEGQVDRWLVSPAIDLTSYAGQNIELAWQAAAGDPDFPDGYEIYISTTGTEVVDFVGDPAFAIDAEDGAGDDGSFTARTLDISEHAGETIYIAFRHNSENMFLLFLDNISVTATPTAGVQDNLASQLSIYPNPASNVINVSNNNSILVNSIVIADLNGRTVKSVKMDGVTNAQVNISDLANGMYMMTVSSDKGTMTKKIVKN